MFAEKIDGRTRPLEQRRGIVYGSSNGQCQNGGSEEDDERNEVPNAV